MELDPLILSALLFVAILLLYLASRSFYLSWKTRRDILQRSADAELSVSRLADAYPMSFAAVQKHVAVLERAGLVSKHRHGREQLVRGNADTMRRDVELLEKLEAAWRGRIDRIGDLVATDRNGGRKP